MPTLQCFSSRRRSLRKVESCRKNYSTTKKEKGSSQGGKEGGKIPRPRRVNQKFLRRGKRKMGALWEVVRGCKGKKDSGGGSVFTPPRCRIKQNPFERVRKEGG